MSMMGELKCFLGLQIKQQKYGILIHQEKYAKDLLKKFDLTKPKASVLPCTLLKFWKLMKMEKRFQINFTNV